MDSSKKFTRCSACARLANHTFAGTTLRSVPATFFPPRFPQRSYAPPIRIAPASGYWVPCDRTAVRTDMNTDEQLPEIMTLKEAAAYFRCFERHIQIPIARGLPHFRLGTLVRFRRADVLAYLARNQRRCRRRQRTEMRDA